MSNIIPNWPAPSNIGALSTTRIGGFSKAPYKSNNLGLHVGDVDEHVFQNRINLKRSLNLPAEPVWLEQTHTNLCVVVEKEPLRVVDAAITRSKDHVLAIMTADCLPILLCDQKGLEIAAIHSGWRGLVNGVIENTLTKMQSKPSNLLAWIGPAICGNCYEVGEEVWESYLGRYPFSQEAFKEHGKKKLANLPKIAELVLQKLGINGIYHSHACTFEQENSFFSYRRENQTGRMATLIWFKQDNN